MQYIQASVFYSQYVLRSFLHAYLCDAQVSQASRGVSADFDALVDLLESLDCFLKRLDIYTKVPPTPAMTEVVAKIMVELLSTIALATKQNRLGRPSESILAGVFRNSMQCRELCEKASQREGCRGGSSEAGPTHEGRGSDDGSAHT